jgi:hypothetical protein
MNLFNSFQAVAFYTLTPFLIQWLFANGHDGWAYLASAGELAGFAMISFAIHEAK